ncbi:hypothetical protein C8R42DRAFT_623797 [Lentinula raphanica]|nr:hypothetical protein C8R42DRAFT_623797 [Lentinula raphanica]
MTSGENISNLSAHCQKVVDDANAGRISLVDAQDQLRAEGISPSVVQSYVVQLQKVPGGGGGGSSTDTDRGKTPEVLDDNQRREFRKQRSEILGRERMGAGGSGGTEGQEGNEGQGEARDSESNVLSHQSQVIQCLVTPNLGVSRCRLWIVFLISEKKLGLPGISMLTKLSAPRGSTLMSRTLTLSLVYSRVDFLLSLYLVQSGNSSSKTR